MAKIGEFLKGVQKRLKDDESAKIFFEVFLVEGLMRKLDQMSSGGSVDSKIEIQDEHSWKVVYSTAAEILFDRALANHSEAHPDIFDEASRVSTAFGQELKERLGFEIEIISIISPVDQWVKEGLVEVVDGLVKPTPALDQAAKEVRDMAKE